MMRRHLPYYDEARHYLELPKASVEGLEEAELPELREYGTSNPPPEIDSTLSMIPAKAYHLTQNVSLEGMQNNVFIVKEEEELDIQISYPKDVCSREVYVIERGAELSISSKVFPSRFSYITREFYVKESASIRVNTVASSSFFELATVLNLEGYGATGYERTAFILSGKDEGRVFSQLNHIAQNTEGDSHVRGVHAGTSTSSIEGMIKIFPGARGANSYLNQFALLMDDALSHTYPSLEIENDDVKASHSASVSTLDEEELFYLMSRGLSKKAAKREVLSGFLSSAVDVRSEGMFMNLIEEVL